MIVAVGCRERNSTHRVLSEKPFFQEKHCAIGLVTTDSVGQWHLHQVSRARDTWYLADPTKRPESSSVGSNLVINMMLADRRINQWSLAIGILQYYFFFVVCNNSVGKWISFQFFKQDLTYILASLFLPIGDLLRHLFSTFCIVTMTYSQTGLAAWVAPNWSASLVCN